VGHSSRFVINERAPGSLESLPVRCRFDFHGGSRRTIPGIGLKFRGKVYGAHPGMAVKKAVRVLPGVLTRIIFLLAF